jgi:hypothetical protein
MLERDVTEQPTPPGFRRHQFMDRSIDLPANLAEVQLDGRACIRYGAEDQPTRPVETWSELSRQLFGRYPERAARCRELATWIEDEYRALSDGHQRKVPLDDCGIFPGTLAP